MSKSKEQESQSQSIETVAPIDKPNRYYTYVLLNPMKPGRYTYKNIVTFFYEPFYVGKGSGHRWTVHFTKAALSKDSQHNIHKVNTIKKINRNNLDTIVVKTLSEVSESEAYENEELLIDTIGRCDLKSGSLTNKNGGGKGNTHCIPWHKGKTGVYSEETIKKRSASLKGKVPWSKGLKLSKEKYKDAFSKRSESLKKYYQSEAGIAKRKRTGEAAKKRYDAYSNEEKKAMILKMTKGNPDYYKSDKFKEGGKKGVIIQNKIFAEKNPIVGFKCYVCGTPTEMPLNKFNKRLEKYKETVCMSKNPGCSMRALAAIKYNRPVIKSIQE